MLEAEHSSQRKIALQMFHNRNEIFAKVSKYDRIGFTVIREAQ